MATAELQFEQLTQELEEERKSIANQLERCKLLSSETASMSSISSTNDSFNWRSPQHQPQHSDVEESETESKVSGSHLVDSCLRVLEDRGVMSSNNYHDYMPEEAYHSQSDNIYRSQNNSMMNDDHPPVNSSFTPNYIYQDADTGPSRPSLHSPASSYRDDPTYQPRVNGQEGDYNISREFSYSDSVNHIESPSHKPDNPPFNGPYGSNNNLNPGNQSPRVNDSFQGNLPSFNKSEFDDTVTYATVNKGKPRSEERLANYLPSDSGRGDQFGSPIQSPDQRQYSGSTLHMEMPPTNRAPSDRPMDSPRSDPYSDRPSQEAYGRRPPLLMPGLDDNRSQSPAISMDRGRSYGSQSRLPPNDQKFTDGPHQESPPMVGAPMPIDADRPPSVHSSNPGFPVGDMRWRNPELPEVIEYLNHHNDMVKANAAAYLQHLCYMDNDVKAKTRGLGGIPVLVELVNNEVPEVHRAACGALKNLSYGRANEENKKAIKNAGGIPLLIRLLRKTPDNDVRELVTGILWNLSSTKDLKRPIIDDGLTVLVSTVIVPQSGWEPGKQLSDRNAPRDIYWSTVFRNGSGVLRNVSSDSQYARTKLRECEGLVDSIVFIVQAAIGKNDIDNKSVENCVCVLRNLSYGCQEVLDPDYLAKRARQRQEKAKGESTSCFGGTKKKDTKDQKNKFGIPNPNFTSPQTNPQGMFLLWHPSIVPIYLPLLYDCTNPETLEAAAGAIQNLAACDWKPSDDIRETVRKQKGLPVLVELLNLEADRVVCAAATALRNLSIDPQSKELIGKYAMRQLVQRLPEEGKAPRIPNADETISSLMALIYEVIKTSTEFATSLLTEGGVERLMYIVRNDKFVYRIRRFASSILTKMWECKDLHGKYREKGWKDVNFLIHPIDPRKGSPSKSLPSSTENTLNRPHMDQSGPTLPGYNENTLPYVNRQPVNNVSTRDHLADNNFQTSNDVDTHGRRYDDVPMTQMGGPPAQPPAQPPGYREYRESPSMPRAHHDDSFSQPPEMNAPYSRFDEPPMNHMGPPSSQLPGYRESPTMGGHYASVDISRQDTGAGHQGNVYHQDDYGQQGEYGPDVSYI